METIDMPVPTMVVTKVSADGLLETKEVENVTMSDTLNSGAPRARVGIAP